MVYDISAACGCPKGGGQFHGQGRVDVKTLDFLVDIINGWPVSQVLVLGAQVLGCE